MYKEPEFEPSRKEMLEILRRRIPLLTRTEVVPLEEACGRVAADFIRAPYSLPNRATSAFDGISVRFRDFEDGIPDTSGWREGAEYAFSNTGVAIREDFDTVIAIEDVEFLDRGLLIHELPRERGENVGKVGEQILEGEILLSPRDTITPARTGLLAAAGITAVTVTAKPVVTFLPTGDELVPPGAPVPPGKNVESNGIMLSAFIRQWGGIPIRFPILPDRKDALRDALLRAVRTSDLVLICAGSSKGTKDYTIEVLEELGELVVQELGHGPGKHGSLAFVEGVPVLGLPGPPMGAELVAGYYGKAALKRMLGQPFSLPDGVRAVLTADVTGNWIDFLFFMHVTRKGSQYFASPVSRWELTRAQGLSSCNGCFYCPRGAKLHAGDFVFVELYVPMGEIPERDPDVF